MDPLDQTPAIVSTKLMAHGVALPHLINDPASSPAPLGLTHLSNPGCQVRTLHYSARTPLHQPSRMDGMGDWNLSKPDETLAGGKKLAAFCFSILQGRSICGLCSWARFGRTWISTYIT